MSGPLSIRCVLTFKLLEIVEPARVIAAGALIPIAWLVVTCCFVSTPFANSGVATMTTTSYFPTSAELKDHDFASTSELS